MQRHLNPRRIILILECSSSVIQIRGGLFKSSKEIPPAPFKSADDYLSRRKKFLQCYFETRLNRSRFWKFGIHKRFWKFGVHKRFWTLGVHRGFWTSGVHRGFWKLGLYKGFWKFGASFKSAEDYLNPRRMFLQCHLNPRIFI